GETGGHELHVEAYERAIDKMKGNEDALPLMSVVARVQEHDLGETDKALETNRRILALRPDDPQAIDALERLYLAKQRYTDLLAIYDKKLALISDPTAKKDIQLKIGQLYEDEIGDDGKAIAAYRAILKESGDELPALATLHRMHERKNEGPELADVLERELAVTVSTGSRGAPDANHGALKFRLGQVREQHLGDVVGAIACYQQILQADPSHEGARAALEKRLPEEQHQLRAANILEPIYELLEAWRDLAAVHEIQLKHERSLERRVGLLTRVGGLQATKLGAAPAAFAAFARAFREDPSRAAVRAELERIAPLMEGGGPAGLRTAGGAAQRSPLEDNDGW